MTAPQPSHAPVLRRHKLLAAELLKGDEIASPGPEWLAVRVAQLAADCEARGDPGALREAWNEGHTAGMVGLSTSRNPYPKADARPIERELLAIRDAIPAREQSAAKPAEPNDPTLKCRECMEVGFHLSDCSKRKPTANEPIDWQDMPDDDDPAGEHGI